MNDSPTSLDRLHDIVEPPPVPWWPPAPGWYWLLAVAAVALTWLAVRHWRRWRANAYRRAALRELTAARTPADVAELLRRTALAVAPRATVASLTGEKWVTWLADSISEAMPAPVQDQLAGAMYEPSAENGEITLLREYAKTWIQRHQLADRAR
jgi:hypothetical protein